MKDRKEKILEIRIKEKKMEASFTATRRLTKENSFAIKQELMQCATHRNCELEINLSGILFIDNTVIDIFNLLSRMARRYDSRLFLSHVGGEVMEMINLIKKHSVFDIRVVIPEKEPMIAA